MGLPRVAHGLVTEHQSINWIFTCPSSFVLFDNQTLANIRTDFMSYKTVISTDQTFNIFLEICSNYFTFLDFLNFLIKLES